MLALANFLICLFLESFVIERVIENTLKRKLHKPEKSKKQYLKMEYELKNYESWPKFKSIDQTPELSVRKEGNLRNIANITCNCQSDQISNDQTVNDFNNSIKPSNGWIGKKNGFENFGFAND